MKREIQDEHVTHDRVVMSLRNLPLCVPPVGLTTSLRVIASRERQRLIENRSFGQIFVSWVDRTRFMLRDMLRPLMLPATGGIFSAVVLFSMWVVPTYPMRAKMVPDIPTNLTTSVDVVDVVKLSLIHISEPTRH